MYRIISFEEQYRDDAIFCMLSALNALGRIPRLNEDLLDIRSHYFDRGDQFWVALDSENRAVGMIGTQTVSDEDLWLKRLFLKPAWKRNGLGSALLRKAEEFAGAKGVSRVHTRFGVDFVEAFRFYEARGFVVQEWENEMCHMMKYLRQE